MRAKKNNTQKVVLVLLAVVLVIGCTIGATLAWLADKTDPVVNTFTSSDVSITLTETDYDNDNEPLVNAFKMVPGADIPKDPTVNVVAGSEACYVFVKVEAKNGVILSSETANAANDYITYAMADGWTLVDGQTNIYYKAVDAAAEGGTEIQVLRDNRVTVLATVTKAMMKAVKDDANKTPELKFTAYAVQQAGFADAKAAWVEAAKLG